MVGVRMAGQESLPAERVWKEGEPCSVCRCVGRAVQPVSAQQPPWWPCSLGTLWFSQFCQTWFLLPTSSLQKIFLFQCSGTFLIPVSPALGKRLHGPVGELAARKLNKTKQNRTVENIFRGLHKYHLCSAYARKSLQ